jgi:hypothetical protein
MTCKSNKYHLVRILVHCFDGETSFAIPLQAGAVPRTDFHLGTSRLRLFDREQLHVLHSERRVSSPHGLDVVDHKTLTSEDALEEGQVHTLVEVVLEAFALGQAPKLPDLTAKRSAAPASVVAKIEIWFGQTCPAVKRSAVKDANLVEAQDSVPEFVLVVAGERIETTVGPVGQLDAHEHVTSLNDQT